jgi:hypothetical protein
VPANRLLLSTYCSLHSITHNATLPHISDACSCNENYDLLLLPELLLILTTMKTVLLYICMLLSQPTTLQPITNAPATRGTPRNSSTLFATGQKPTDTAALPDTTCRRYQLKVQ